MDRPIVKGEPLCEWSAEYNKLHGLEPDQEFDREGRGPHEGCFCDVCFYGHRKNWLAGFDAGVKSTRQAEPHRDKTCRTCGHTSIQHIYGTGACRPGFVCEAECTEFA